MAFYADDLDANIGIAGENAPAGALIGSSLIKSDAKESQRLKRKEYMKRYLNNPTIKDYNRAKARIKNLQKSLVSMLAKNKRKQRELNSYLSLSRYVKSTVYERRLRQLFLLENQEEYIKSALETLEKRTTYIVSSNADVRTKTAALNSIYNKALFLD
ncbi:MAG: hypothetical protein ACP5RP_01220 [Candidatus Micrarchaeia archaeon]